MSTKIHAGTLTVAELRETLEACDPSAKVVLLSPDRDDVSWELRGIIDDESGSWVMLEPGQTVPVRGDD